MNWYEYIYNSPKYIINNIKLVSEFWLIEYLILILIIFLFIILIYYIIPYICILIEYIKKEKDKAKRKKLIKTIIIQKDLNDEIEKDLKLN